MARKLHCCIDCCCFLNPPLPLFRKKHCIVCLYSNVCMYIQRHGTNIILKWNLEVLLRKNYFPPLHMVHFKNSSTSASISNFSTTQKIDVSVQNYKNPTCPYICTLPRFQNLRMLLLLVGLYAFALQYLLVCICMYVHDKHLLCMKNLNKSLSTHQEYCACYLNFSMRILL